MTYLHIEDRAVRLVRVGGVDIIVPLENPLLAAPPNEVLRATSQALDQAAIAGESVTIILSSTVAYVHAFETPQRRPTKAMLRFSFEEFLPLDIEQLTCAFLQVDGRYIGFAMETARWRPLLELLHKRGVCVERITLDAMARSNRTAALLWVDADHVTWIAEQLRTFRVWRFAATTAIEERVEAVQVAIAEHEVSKVPTQVWGTVAPEILHSIAASLGTELSNSADFQLQPFHLNLATDGLRPAGQAGRQAQIWRRTALLGLAASLLILAGLGYRARQIQTQLDAIAAWESRAWAGVFPQQPVPGSVAMRIASERKRLEALTSPSTAASARPDALRLLCDIVAAFPADARIDLQELRIENADVIVRGRTTDHPQAERIAQAVNALSSLDCDPVRTDRSRDAGVQFFLHARPPTAKQTLVAKGGSHD